MTQPLLNVVLYEPQIPPNTGNIGRSCVALNSKLFLVEPLGFELSEKALRRAGLDYWQDLDVEVVPSFTKIEQTLDCERMFLFSRFATHLYTDVEYRAGDTLVFGSEPSGLPDEIHKKYAKQLVTIPMPGPIRCLNLSVSAGIAMYEAYRQISQLQS